VLTGHPFTHRKTVFAVLALLALGALVSCVKTTPPPVEPPPVISLPAKATSVLVYKERHKLYLMRGEHVLYSFDVALGHHPMGPKTEEGDERTPEGLYLIDWRNPNSRFYRSLHISYPNALDSERARTHGAAPGGNVMIHGLPPGYETLGKAHTQTDWTDGCIAVTNEEMDIIWNTVEDFTPIEIKP
jgi:murein L,D-transpeptidase YafK